MNNSIFSATGLAGLTVFVTGGAQGIGAACVRTMASAGAKLIFSDIEATAGQALAESTNAQFAYLDMLDLEAVEQFISKCDPIDVLVNNVGVDQHALFTNMPPRDWQSLLRINLETVFASTRAVLPNMQKNGFGRIICIASEAARQGSMGGAVYAAAKGGVISFTKSIARENARYGITANTVCPGPIQTPLLDAAIAGYGGIKLETKMKNATLLGRLGTAEDVANLVVYLASKEAGFMTGETIGVSGGMGC